MTKDLSSGDFHDEPLRSFIAGDPWGKNPLPDLKGQSWGLSQCLVCGMKYHNHILSPEGNEIRFTEWMDQDAIREFEKRHRIHANGAELVQHVLRLQDMSVKRVLDFGCGFGDFLNVCRLFGLEAVGVDRSDARRDGGDVQIYADLAEVEGKFGAITMFEVLEHLDDPLDMLRQLKGKLEPGGVMIVEVPDTTGVEDIKTVDDYRKIHPLDHINAFTPKTVNIIMKTAGFKPIVKKPAFVTTSPIRIAKNVAKSVLKRQTTQRYYQLI